jgi:hypothetical protein
VTLKEKSTVEEIKISLHGCILHTLAHPRTMLKSRYGSAHIPLSKHKISILTSKHAVLKNYSLHFFYFLVTFNRLFYLKYLFKYIIL